MIRSAFWAALALALFMALSPHPPKVSIVGDKYQHMLAFITLTALACAAWPSAELLRTGERMSFLGAVIELVQSIKMIHRDRDAMDWVADTVAVIGVLLVVRLVRRARIAHADASPDGTLP